MTSLPAGLLTELFLASIPAAEQQEIIRDIIQKLQPPPGRSLDIAATQVAVKLLRASPDVSFFRSITFLLYLLLSERCWQIFRDSGRSRRFR